MFKKFNALVENKTGRKIKKPRTDNFNELFCESDFNELFCESDFNELCATLGIARHKTLVGKPQQNGAAKRINQTLLERARCMLSNANLWHHHDFWAEAVSMAYYLVNRSPHASINFKNSEEVWLGNPVEYSILWVVGCSAYAHVNNGKLAPRAVKCMFLGYASESKGYRLWCPDSKKVIQSRDINFNETVMFSPGK